MEYLENVRDTASQRHKNQTIEVPILASEQGYAAKVRNPKTGATKWIRMVQ